MPVIFPHRGVAAFLFALTLTACGGPTLERLHGEPKSTRPLTYVPEDASPPADGVRAFITGIAKGDIERAYVHLSAFTRRALRQRAQAAGMRGIDLLRPVPAGASEGDRRLRIADPIATFALADPTRIEVGPTSIDPTRPADGKRLELSVTLYAHNGHSRTITVRFEGLHWRIHNPLLRR